MIVYITKYYADPVKRSILDRNINILDLLETRNSDLFFKVTEILRNDKNPDFFGKHKNTGGHFGFAEIPVDEYVQVIAPDRKTADLFRDFVIKNNRDIESIIPSDRLDHNLFKIGAGRLDLKITNEYIAKYGADSIHTNPNWKKVLEDEFGYSRRKRDWYNDCRREFKGLPLSGSEGVIEEAGKKGLGDWIKKNPGKASLIGAGLIASGIGLYKLMKSEEQSSNTNRDFNYNKFDRYKGRFDKEDNRK